MPAVMRQSGVRSRAVPTVMRQSGTKVHGMRPYHERE